MILPGPRRRIVSAAALRAESARHLAAEGLSSAGFTLASAVVLVCLTVPLRGLPPESSYGILLFFHLFFAFIFLVTSFWRTPFAFLAAFVTGSAAIAAVLWLTLPLGTRAAAEATCALWGRPSRANVVELERMRLGVRVRTVHEVVCVLPGRDGRPDRPVLGSLPPPW